MRVDFQRGGFVSLSLANMECSGGPIDRPLRHGAHLHRRRGRPAVDLDQGSPLRFRSADLARLGLSASPRRGRVEDYPKHVGDRLSLRDDPEFIATYDAQESACRRYQQQPLSDATRDGFREHCHPVFKDC